MRPTSSSSCRARAAAVSLRSARYLRINGQPLPPVWDPLSGFYPVRDGWISIHCNFQNHRDAAMGRWQELYCGPTAQDHVRRMPAERSLDVVGVLVCGAVFGRGLTACGGGPESWVQDVLDVVFTGILSDAARAPAGGRAPSAMPAPAASEAPLPM